jgi:hypothetical protein
MKLLKIHILVLTALTVILVYACTNSTSPQPNGVKNYVPGKTGNYWIYNKIRIDTNNNTIATLNPYDSTTVIGDTLLFGKNLSRIADFDLTTTPIQKLMEMDMYSENSRVFLRSDFINSVIGLNDFTIPFPVTIPDTMLMIADANATTAWSIFTKDVPDVSIPLPNGLGNAILNGAITVNGAFKATENVTIGTQTVAAQKFEISFGFNGKINSFLPIDISRTIDIWFADNIGMVQISLAPFKMTVPLVNLPIGMEGWSKTVIRYHVNL